MATAAGSEFNAICPGCTEPYLGGPALGLWSQAMGCDYVANVELFMGQLLGTAGCLSEPWASVARGP